MSVFGSNGSGNILQCRELSRQDKINLLRVGVGKNLLEPETEARLIATEPRLDLELHDTLKASTISFKFVAVKTAFSLSTVVFPTKLYFTFKFFTFTGSQTETVYLRDPASPVPIDTVPKMGTQYLL